MVQARNPSNVTEQTHLILAVVLLQTIGIFHEQANYRASSNVCHEMVVTVSSSLQRPEFPKKIQRNSLQMIRQSGLIHQISSWKPPSLNDPTQLDTTWREWADHETLKRCVVNNHFTSEKAALLIRFTRALLLLYLHDCHRCMHSSLPSSFHPSEFNINLPCDEAIWTAGNALEWFEALQGPSLYGSGQGRLLGVSMQQALMSLGQTRIPSLPFSLNPFASFVLIHSILRNLHGARTGQQASDEYSARPKTLLDDISAAMGGAHDHAFAAQYALHNWLQAWLNGPEISAFERGWDRPPFVCNALPFHWLAQVSHFALHECTYPDAAPAVAKTGLRFQLLRQWLEQVRGFIQRKEKIPPHLWDEIMKIRLQVSFEADTGTSDNDGLLAFFPQH